MQPMLSVFCGWRWIASSIPFTRIYRFGKKHGIMILITLLLLQYTALSLLVASIREHHCISFTFPLFSL